MYDHVPHGVLLVYCRIMGYQGLYFEPSGPYTAKVRVVFVFLATTQTLSPLLLALVSSPVYVFHEQDLMAQSDLGDPIIVSLLFADDVLLLAFSSCDLQHALGWFVA